MRLKRRLWLGVGVAVVGAAATLGYTSIRASSPDGTPDHISLADHSVHKSSDQESAHVHTTSTYKPALQLAAPPVVDTRYTCPMHPAIVMDHPGSCPICGMTLVKLANNGGEEAGQSNQVHVSLPTQQRMGVQLQPAAVVEMHQPINTFATVFPDESRTVSVHSSVDGWIRRWHIRGVGQAVKKGQVLYELYSPDLQQRQRDYINLLQRREAMIEKNPGMNMSRSAFSMMGALAKERFRTRNRLLAAGIPKAELELLEKSRRVKEVMPIQATQDGVVTAIFAREGSFINPSQVLLVYTDNTTVWAEITVFPDQISWLKNGDDVMLTPSLNSSARIMSHIDLSTLQIDPGSRTAKLRLPLADVGDAFRPGTYLNVVIKSGTRSVLGVPRDALIRTGHGNFVVVSDSENHFRSVLVDIGIEDKQSVEIRSGLSEGARVVVNGQFLLDAAASFQAMQARFASPAASAPPSDQNPSPSAALQATDVQPHHNHDEHAADLSKSEDHSTLHIHPVPEEVHTSHAHQQDGSHASHGHSHP